MAKKKEGNEVEQKGKYREYVERPDGTTMNARIHEDEPNESGGGGRDDTGKFLSGNRFWKLRLKHGRDRIVKDSQSLWENFEEYAEWIETNLRHSIDYKGSTITEVKMPKMRPMTKNSFALACGLARWESIEHLKSVSPDFLDIIERIEGYIFYQKFEGAASGLLKESIISRELGLGDQQTITNLNHNVPITDAEIEAAKKEFGSFDD